MTTSTFILLFYSFSLYTAAQLVNLLFKSEEFEEDNIYGESDVTRNVYGGILTKLIKPIGQEKMDDIMESFLGYVTIQVTSGTYISWFFRWPCTHKCIDSHVVG